MRILQLNDYPVSVISGEVSGKELMEGILRKHQEKGPVSFHISEDHLIIRKDNAPNRYYRLYDLPLWKASIDIPQNLIQ
jgi:hypothetical protein